MSEKTSKAQALTTELVYMAFNKAVINFSIIYNSLLMFTLILKQNSTKKERKIINTLPDFLSNPVKSLGDIVNYFKDSFGFNKPVSDVVLCIIGLLIIPIVLSMIITVIGRINAKAVYKNRKLPEKIYKFADKLVFNSVSKFFLFKTRFLCILTGGAGSAIFIWTMHTAHPKRDMTEMVIYGIIFGIVLAIVTRIADVVVDKICAPYISASTVPKATKKAAEPESKPYSATSSETNLNDDPKEWSVSFVKAHPAFCKKVIRDDTILIRKYLKEGKYDAVVGGLDHTIAGIITLDKAELIVGAPYFAGLSYIEGAVIMVAMNDYPEDRRRAVAKGMYEDARDASTSELQDWSMSALRDLNSGMSFFEFKRKNYPCFPNELLECMDIVIDNMQ